MATWQLQEAKNKFSAVVEAAASGGPQLNTKRGAATAVLISAADYRQLVGTQQKLSEFYRDSPLAGARLDIRRDTSGGGRPALKL